MTESPTEHVFNDDLLANAGDLDKVCTLYPHIVPVLDHPEMRALFSSYDKPANEAKTRSRTWGIRAILLVAASLLVTATEPLIGPKETPWSWPPDLWHSLVFVMALAAVAGVMIGAKGILFRGAKETWLYRRLMTERLRQFHFQTLICRLPEIVRAHAARDGYAGYIGQRARWLAGFQKRFEGKLGAEFRDIVDSDSADRQRASDLWLHPPLKMEGVDAANPAVMQIFDAYRTLRIKHQLQYANMKLGESHTWLSPLPGSQVALFSNISFVLIVALVVIHVAIAVFSLTIHETEAHISIATWIEVASLWIAILALFMRALEEGLKPDREVERYRHYRSAIHAVSDRFEEAESPADKIEVMKEMERLVYDEMCDFMRTHHDARFVM